MSTLKHLFQNPACSSLLKHITYFGTWDSLFASTRVPSQTMYIMSQPRGSLLPLQHLYLCWRKVNHKKKKSRNNLSSHDRGLQRYCLSPWCPTDQTQIKWSKINSLLIMWVLQSVTGTASGRQASWLHISRNPTWTAETLLVWQEFVVLCDHPPKVNKTDLVIAGSKDRKKIPHSIPKPRQPPVFHTSSEAV